MILLLWDARIHSFVRLSPKFCSSRCFSLMKLDLRNPGASEILSLQGGRYMQVWDLDLGTQPLPGS